MISPPWISYLSFLFYTITLAPFTSHTDPRLLYFVRCGLGAFMFSAGYKLFLNHSQEFDDRTFVMGYARKRLIALGAPYLAYTLILFAIGWAFTMYPSPISTLFPWVGYIPLNWNILAGMSPIAGHLWFLYALLVITLLTLVILYAAGPKALFYLIFPALLIYSVLDPHALKCEGVTDLIYVILTYSIIFLAGGYMALMHSKALTIALSCAFLLFFGAQ